LAEFTLNGLGQITQTLEYDLDEELVWRHEFQYDAAGNMIKQDAFHPDGALIITRHHEYAQSTEPTPNVQGVTMALNPVDLLISDSQTDKRLRF